MIVSLPLLGSSSGAGLGAGPTWSTLSSGGAVTTVASGAGVQVDPAAAATAHEAAQAGSVTWIAAHAAVDAGPDASDTADAAAAVGPSPATLLLGGLLVGIWALRFLKRRSPARTKPRSLGA